MNADWLEDWQRETVKDAAEAGQLPVWRGIVEAADQEIVRLKEQRARLVKQVRAYMDSQYNDGVDAHYVPEAVTVEAKALMAELEPEL